MKKKVREKRWKDKNLKKWKWEDEDECVNVWGCENNDEWKKWKDENGKVRIWGW